MAKDNTVPVYNDAEDDLHSVLDVPSDNNQDTNLESNSDSNEVVGA